MRKYYKAFGRAAGRIIAQRSGATLSYFLADHLNSTLGTVDAATAAVSASARHAAGGRS